VASVGKEKPAKLDVKAVVSLIAAQTEVDLRLG
jgi:hypothetical protein